MFVLTVSAGLLTAMALLARPHTAVPVVPFLFLAGLLAGSAHGFLHPALAALLMDVPRDLT